ncbi:MAG: type VI secretion system membrane subunit TssM [Enterobacteriaceae bacterium]|jgi:type VI secretion system protein ImpL|nr:type VI secretion system membrane subunit TssM [Enterobacteriaceae bacterium]
MLDTLLSIIVSRLMWSFLGIAAISSVIWFIGPIISVGNTAPFASSGVRIAVIIALFFIWLLSILISRLYRAWLEKKRANQSNNDNAEAKEKHQSKLTSAIGSGTLLSERFSDAVKLLKKAYLSGLQGKDKPSWRGIFSRQYVYQLPWYLVIGAPDSGKTTVLANSGLNFPLLDYFGKAALYNVRDMNSCNWWFTNDAVLLDTAGRYTTQDSASSIGDSKEWNSIIRLLKKHRARQPINGILITISIEDLLNAPADIRDKQAFQVRRRLSELHETFKTQFPIYVIITKTDLLKGFTAYFTHADKTAREQIWGFTFPQDKATQDKHADLDIPTIFEEQYSQLQRRLDAELPAILLNESNPQQCAESYLFPQEFADLRPRIAQYLDIVFARSGFETPFYPRGLYFTSGIQDGIALDPVMEKFNRHFQLPINNDSVSMSWGNAMSWENSVSWKNNSGNANFSQTGHRTYFVKNLLENIFQEAGLASNNRWWIYRNCLFHWLGYITLMAMLVFVTTLFFASYNNNKNYLAEVKDKLPAIQVQGNKLKKNYQGANEVNKIYAMLPLLDNLTRLAESENFQLDDPPVSYRMGLFKGEQVSHESDSLYKKALNALLLPQIATLITNQLINDNGDDTEKTNSTLKAYLMLYDSGHYEGKYLRDWIMQYMAAHLDQETTQAQLQQLDKHLRQLLDNQPISSPFPRNEDLIEQKQAFIGSIPPAQRAYTVLKQKLQDDSDLTPVDLVALATPQAELVFSSSGRVAINHQAIDNSIPGMFTPAGYQKMIGKDLLVFLTKMYTQDKWVLGTYAGLPTIKELELSVRQLYIDDYITQWDNFLAGIHLKNISDLPQLIRTTRLLSSPDSPLRSLLMNISKNVTLNNQLNGLMQQGKARGLASKLAKKQEIKTTLPQGNQLSPEPFSPEKSLNDHFVAITDLAKKNPDGKSNNIPFDDILKEIGKLYNHLISIQKLNDAGMTLPGDMVSQLQIASENLPVPFRNIIDSLSMRSSSATQRYDMEKTRQAFAANIGNFYYQAIANRYPLTHDSLIDIKPDDMTHMFAPEKGLMSAFFQKNLAGKVDTSQINWQFIPDADGQTPPDGDKLLAAFQQAQIISDSFFSAGTATPSFRVTVRPIKMSNDILSMELDIDGQKLQYSHGPQFSKIISWPGAVNTNQVNLQINPVSGAPKMLTTSGFWALNRLVDQAKRIRPEKTANANQIDETSIWALFNLGGHTVLLEFTSNSHFNPLDPPAFSYPNPKSMKTL